MPMLDCPFQKQTNVNNAILASAVGGLGRHCRRDSMLMYLKQTQWVSSCKEKKSRRRELGQIGSKRTKLSQLERKQNISNASSKSRSSLDWGVGPKDDSKIRKRPPECPFLLMLVGLIVRLLLQRRLLMVHRCCAGTVHTGTVGLLPRCPYRSHTGLRVSVSTERRLTLGCLIVQEA